jgi:hypothetical protein
MPDPQPEMASELVLHTNHICPFAQRAWLTLEELGVPYRQQIVSIAAGEKDPAFTELYQKALGANEGSDGKVSLRAPFTACAINGRHLPAPADTLASCTLRSPC